MTNVEIYSFLAGIAGNEGVRCGEGKRRMLPRPVKGQTSPLVGNATGRHCAGVLAVSIIPMP